MMFVTQIEGDAAHVLPTLDQQYDFIFMDSAKAKYIEFFPHCMRVLKQWGIGCYDIFQGGTFYKMKVKFHEKFGKITSSSKTYF